MPTTRSGRSLLVLLTAAVPEVTRSPSCDAPMRKLLIITGMLRISVMMPAVATAPAPM